MPDTRLQIAHLRAACVVSGLIVASPALSQENAEPYVDGSKPFIVIEDTHSQADAWATCAATYDFVAAITADEAPARSQQIAEMANGAELAVIMSIVAVDMADPSEMTPERFGSLWTAAQMIGTELPTTRRTMLAAQAEADPDAFMERLSATFDICIKNAEGQQAYIDMWRDLAKSGLLELPAE